MLDIVEHFDHGHDTIVANLIVDDTYEDHPVSVVYLECGAYSGTLDFLDAYNALEDLNGNQYTVSKTVKKEILEWAIQNGY
jgi:hypothetical protein